MISRRHKLIYIHINKTGGTSIESLFRNGTNDQLTALEIKDAAGEELWEKYFKFATVRNPWDRMVSEYFFRKTSHIINPKQWRCPKHLIVPPHKGFKEWILEDHESPNSEYIRFRSQINWLKNKKGEIIVDRICRFETLKEDFQRICDHMGLDWKLPHHNKTRHMHYSYYYDDRTKQIVKDRHREDIEYFGYEFHPRALF